MTERADVVEPTVAGRPACVRLCGLRSEPIDVREAYDAVLTPASGGVALFVGTVRDQDEDRAVTRLSYTPHPTADRVLSEVVAGVLADHPADAVAVLHRVGELAVGDVAVVVGVSCAHRGDAFDGCRALIDEIKHRLPVWKHQHFADGSDSWVGSP
ncbi:MAG TPA: molybdenum cofactor biosynthesis protein MoaE [Nocardioidaceae bacterium]|nr:molybdenum cofactor biosynthesis protein MoaE [Nocardioidaceae bacterium]